MKRRNGFTLVEAAVAIAVVAILSGIIIPLILKSIRDARSARARNDIHVIAAAIAHQLKDTGSRRPNAAAGPGAATGVGNAVWYSAGDRPGLTNAGGLMAGVNLPPVGAAAAGGPAAGTFAELFLAPNANLGYTLNQANALFGYPAWVGEREFQYRGPYMTQQAATSTDPWGNAYIILGYNETGQAANDGQGGPIWVVSAGEGRTINGANVGAAGAGNAPCTVPPVWNYTNGSEHNIALQVH